MTLPRVGLDLPRKETGAAAVDAIIRAEARGVPMIWSTVGGVRPDAMTFFAAALARTSTIRLGTAIVPTYPRHPAMLYTQAVALDQIAPGRFRLGIGPSHRSNMVGAFGLEFGTPLDHLREYLEIVRSLLETGGVDFDGDYFNVHIQGGATAAMPIYVSALRRNAFRLAGEIADGAISWLCPPHFLNTAAAPAMRESAGQAGRETPRLVAHVPVVLAGDLSEVRRVAGPVVSRYAQQPFYANMFADAGFPVQADGSVSDDLLDHLVVNGDADAVRQRLEAILDGPIDELLIMMIPSGDAAGEEEHLSAIIAEMSPST
jgi:F420-dependent oxidoreductase-like protein